MFTLAVAVPTCLAISIWSIDGSFLLHASLGRYAAIGVGGILGLSMMAWGRVERLEGFDLGWLAIVFLICISWPYSIDPSASIGRGIPMVAWSFCLYALIRAMLSVSGGALAILDALHAAAGFFLLAGAILAFTNPERVFAGGRYTSSFRSASAVGEVCCILLPVAVWAARHHPSRLARVPYSLLVLVMSCSLIASQVRNAIGAVIAGLVATFLVRRRRNWVGEAPLLVALFAICLCGAYFCYSPFSRTDFFRRYVSRGGTLQTATGRFILWKESFRRIQERPVLGYGYGTESVAIFSMELPPYLRESSHQLSRYQRYLPFLKLNAFEGLHAHNTLIGVLVELGAVGLAAFCAVLVCAFRGILGLTPVSLASPYKTLPPFIIGALTAGLLNSMFESDLLSPGGIGFALFWLIVAISEAVRRSATSSSQRQSQRASVLATPGPITLSPRLHDLGRATQHLEV